MRIRPTLVATIIIVAISKGVVAPGTNAAPVRQEEPHENALDAMRQTISREVSRKMTQNFRVSLEMRENVDFLLTPALLVQEAISHGVVVTYPAE